MKKINKISILILITLLVFSSISFAGEKSLFDDMFKGLSKDKKVNDILSAVALKYIFGAMGNMMSGAFKVDTDMKISVYPSEYAKKVSGTNKPIGALAIFSKGSYIIVSPNITAMDGKSNIIDIQMLKKGKNKAKVALPSNKIYSEVNDFEEIFNVGDKIGEILPIPKKGKEDKGTIIDKKDIKKAKDDVKIEASYLGLNEINSEKVHQIKFTFKNKKSKKEMFVILLDVTDTNLDLRRLVFDQKWIKGNLLINKLAFEKASIKDVNALESAFQGYKKVNIDEFKDILFSTIIVNIFKLLK